MHRVETIVNLFIKDCSKPFARITCDPLWVVPDYLFIFCSISSQGNVVSSFKKTLANKSCNLFIGICHTKFVKLTKIVSGVILLNIPPGHFHQSIKKWVDETLTFGKKMKMIKDYIVTGNWDHRSGSTYNCYHL